MKLLGIKAFLRGGYRELTDPVLVVSHAEPAGIWIPYRDGRLQVRDRGTAAELERLVQDRQGAAPRRRQPSADGQDAGSGPVPDAAGESRSPSSEAT